MNNSMECVAYLFADSGLPKLDFSIVTSVNFAFAIPTPEGHVRPLENAPLARAAVEAAHAWGRKICLSLGGWSYEEIPLEATFCQATDTPEKRQLLADEIVAMARAYDFDGVDVDWEYPRVSSGSKAQYEDFLRRLRAQLPVGEAADGGDPGGAGQQKRAHHRCGGGHRHPGGGAPGPDQSDDLRLRRPGALLLCLR